MAKENADNDLLSSAVDGENFLIQKIQKTHAPGLDEYNVKPLVAIVEDIMIRAPPSSATIITHLGAPSHDDGTVKSDNKDVAQIAKVLESPINYTSYMMTWKCVGWVDSSHAATMQLLKSLSNYSWDAKAVIACAAFAINYGEFSMLTDESSDKTIATLMGLSHDAFESYHSEDVQRLLLTVIRLTRCIAVDFKDLKPKYIELHLKPHEIPLAVYLIIRALVICASLLKDILCDHKKITDKGNEILSKLRDRLYSEMQKFEKRVIEFRKLDEIELRYIEFQEIMSTSHTDNMKVLSAFFRQREADQMPLYNGSRKTNDRLEVLRNKYVLLLISDLDLPQEELYVLELIHNEQAIRHDYEILWLPVVDPKAPVNEMQHTTFTNLKNSMPWFSVNHPSAVEPLAIRYIREKLRFTHAPMLVVLDPYGKLSHHDVLPMLWIWGTKAFPFTKDCERKLWDDTEWNIDLIVDSIDPRIPEWIITNRVICLYGGDDIGWVRKFTQSARTAARALNVQLEMLYVGKRNPKERVRLCHEVIARENLSHIFAIDYYDYVWFFWVRLVSMWNSKRQMGRTVDDDHIMQGILDLLTHDASDLGWAIFSRGNRDTTMARGNDLIPVLENYTTWGHEVDHPDKFVPVLDKQLREHQPEHECKRLILPSQAGYIPERVICMECGKPMDKYTMYRCCTD